MSNSAPNDSQKKLSRIIELFAEDLDVQQDRGSDEEVDTFVAQMLSAAESEAANRLLQTAKEQVAAFWSEFEKEEEKGAVGDPRARLEELLRERPDLLDNLTVAARAGKEWDAEDLRQTIEDLEIIEKLNRRAEGN